MPLQEVHGAEPIVRIVIGGDLLEHELRAVVLLDDLDRARFVGDRDRRPAGDEIEPVHRLIVLSHIIETLGRPHMVVERDARRDDVDEGGAFVLDRGLDHRHHLFLVAGERAGDKGGAELQRECDEVDGIVGIGRAALGFRSAVGGCRELAFGEAVDAIILDDIDHVHAAAQRVRELPEPDRGGITVAGHTEIDEIAVGQVCAREHRWHAPVHGIEAV